MKVPDKFKEERDGNPNRLNPGSVRAVEFGCICPQEDNHHGAGRDGQGRDFWVDPKCPLHKLRKRRK